MALITQAQMAGLRSQEDEEMRRRTRRASSRLPTVDTSSINSAGGSTTPAPVAEPPAQQPQAPAGDSTATLTADQMQQDVAQNDIDQATLMRGLQLLQGGNTTTDADRERVRRQAELAGAQESRAMRAQFGAGGFGTSGLAATALSNAAVENQLATEQAVSDLDAAGRQEQLQRLLAGSNLAVAGRQSMQDQQRWDLIQQLLGDAVTEDEAITGDGANFDLNGDGIVQDNEQALADAAAGAVQSYGNATPIDALMNGDLRMFAGKSKEEIKALLIKNGMGEAEAEAAAAMVTASLSGALLGWE